MRIKTMTLRKRNSILFQFLKHIILNILIHFFLFCRAFIDRLFLPWKGRKNIIFQLIFPSLRHKYEYIFFYARNSIVAIFFIFLLLLPLLLCDFWELWGKLFYEYFTNILYSIAFHFFSSLLTIVHNWEYYLYILHASYFLT